MMMMMWKAEKQRHRKRRSPNPLVHSQIPTTAWAGPTWNPRTQSKFPMCAIGFQVLELLMSRNQKWSMDLNSATAIWDAGIPRSILSFSLQLEGWIGDGEHGGETAGNPGCGHYRAQAARAASLNINKSNHLSSSNCIYIFLLYRYI